MRFWRKCWRLDGPLDDDPEAILCRFYLMCAPLTTTRTLLQRNCSTVTQISLKEKISVVYVLEIRHFTIKVRVLTSSQQGRKVLWQKEKILDLKSSGSQQKANNALS
jgi:hypothetical protein